MRSGHLLLASCVTGLLTACNVSVTEQRSVEISGEAPLEQKVALARRVAISVRNAGLYEKIRARFPDVTTEQLKGLDVRWQTLTGAERSTSGTKSGDAFFLQCAITLPRPVKSTGVILDYCKDLLEAELAHTQTH